MIKMSRQGHYTLLESKGQTKILILDEKDTFAWINAENIGEILITSHKNHKTDAILATGDYRIYEVKNEPKLVDLTHLELAIGEGRWQGYLLLTGLPDDKDFRNRIIPTHEVITNRRQKNKGGP